MENPIATYLLILSNFVILNAETTVPWYENLPAVAMDYKVHIDAGKEDCYFQFVNPGATFYVSFQVLRGGDGMAGFAVRHPSGAIVHPYQWKPHSEYQDEHSTGGYYSVCIDNQFSRFAGKLVNLYLTVVRPEKLDAFSKELEDMDLSVSNVTESLGRVQQNINEMLQHQHFSRGREARDYNVLLDNKSYVQNWSIVQIFVIILTTATQLFQMFGLIVSGQLVKTDFQLVGEKQFLINVPKADAINHIVIFLTGTIPFPDGCGGLVYFSFPDPNSPPCWHLLGFVSNEKPSAIFKVSNLKNTTKYALNADGTTMMFGQGDISLNAQIGIAIESMANIQQQCPTTLTETISVPAFVEFSQKMLQNFMNYASSFVVTQAQMVPNPTESFIPSSVLTTWYSNFERRLMQNPYFWRD